MGAGGLLLIGSFFVAMIVINGVCGGGCARVCVCVGASDGRAEPGSQETPLLTSDSCVLVWRRGSEITCVFVTGRSLVCEWHGDGGRDPSPIRPVCFIDYSYTHTLDVQVQDFLCNCVVFFTFLIKADSLVPGRVPVLDGLWEGMMEAPPPWAEIPLLPHVLWGPRDGGRGQELQRTSVWGTGL